jgi:hypothetical protein
VVAIYSAPGAVHVGRLEFSEPRFPRGYFACTGMLALDGDEWLVEMEMIGPYRSDMLGFFEEMASEAEPGWRGTRSWESEFHEMRVEATNDGRGLTTLGVLIQWMRPVGEEDDRYGELTVASAELTRLALEMKRFLHL